MSQSSSVPLSPSLTPDYSLTGANATLAVPYPSARR